MRDGGGVRWCCSSPPPANTVLFNGPRFAGENEQFEGTVAGPVKVKSRALILDEDSPTGSSQAVEPRKE